MTSDTVTLLAGGLLFALAAGSAALTTRRLIRNPTSAHGRQHGALRTLLWLLATTALAAGAAALWAGPGLDIGSTWPFAIVLVIALAPLAAAAVFRRRHGPPA